MDTYIGKWLKITLNHLNLILNDSRNQLIEMLLTMKIKEIEVPDLLKPREGL